MSAPGQGNGIVAELVGAFAGRRILVTGHTGFKGAWLSSWLARLGADVTGLALAPDQGSDNLYDRAGVGAVIAASILLDIRNAEGVRAVIADTRPDIIFHLAAQPLVRASYADPVGTFATNVMGTAHVLEAARQCDSVKALVCVTTDKVYDNKEWAWPYRETDALGGKDPYSASKAACEMAVHCYMTALQRPDGGRIAVARGGNVIGGGDWSADRLTPDIVRAIRASAPLTLRFPQATRPWQHVLELCYAYMLLAHRLIAGWPAHDKSPDFFSDVYNFGPDPAQETSVAIFVQRMLAAWGAQDYPITLNPAQFHEAHALRLDSSKARTQIGWAPVLNFEETIDWTARWYCAYCAAPDSAAALVQHDIEVFERKMIA